jgi:hypothetical protein
LRFKRPISSCSAMLGGRGWRWTMDGLVMGCEVWSLVAVAVRERDEITEVGTLEKGVALQALERERAERC